MQPHPAATARRHHCALAVLLLTVPGEQMGAAVAAVDVAFMIVYPLFYCSWFTDKFVLKATRLHLRCLGQTRGFLHSVSCVTPDKLAVSLSSLVVLG